MSAFQIEIPVKLYGETTPLPEALLSYGGQSMIEVTSAADLARGKRVLIPGEIMPSTHEPAQDEHGINTGACTCGKTH